MNAIKDFWLSSYQSDKVAFYYEMASFVFILVASMTMAITADNPDMRYIYPGYFIGSLTAVYAHWRRKLAWPTMLVGYFTIVNVFGWLVAMRFIN